MATVFLNGAFVSQDDARLSVFDAGLQHGVGLFETLLGGTLQGQEPGAWALRLDEHIERLTGSARALGLSDQLRPGPLAEAVLRTISKSGLPRARIRLTVTGGDLNLLGKKPEGADGRQATAPIQPTILIVAQPATQYPPEMFERGITASIADLRINPLDPLAGHKTLHYWARLRELQAAAAKHAGEALVFQVTNHLAGGCVSNAFIIKDGRLLTPIARGEEGGGSKGGAAVPSPVLPGITRGWVLEWAGSQRLEVARQMLTIDDVLGADEVFLTNSSWGVLPVVRVEKEAIADGGVGRITEMAVSAWNAAAGP